MSSPNYNLTSLFEVYYWLASYGLGQACKRISFLNLPSIHSLILFILCRTVSTVALGLKSAINQKLLEGFFSL